MQQAASTEPVPRGLGLAHDHGRSLRVTHDGAELTRYVYQPWDAQLESPRPYWHPVRTLGGDVVSLYRPHDHVWHKGIAWSLPNVGAANFWGGTTYLRDRGYVQLPNDGSMRHRRFGHVGMLRAGTATERVHVAHELEWVTADGEVWFAERRSWQVAVHADAEAWSLVFATDFTNVSDAVVPIGSPTTQGRHNAGYGGLFWRGPRSFTGGKVYAPGTVGADDLMGVRGPWLAFSGKHDDHGRQSTCAFVDDPGNPGHPTQWFARSEIYACVCPAPFFSTEVPVAPGESLTLRYAVLVADGDRGLAGATKLAEVGQRALEESTAVRPDG
jgi:hypothetical protein